MKIQEIMKKTLSIVLCFALVFTSLYIPEGIIVQAAESEELSSGENTDDSVYTETLESLGFDLPEDFDTDEINPGDHPLNSMEEVVIEKYNANKTDLSIYDYDANSDVRNLSDSANILDYSVEGRTVRSISTTFDGHGNGKKEYIAYLYLDDTDGYGGNIYLGVDEILEWTDDKREIRAVTNAKPIGASIKTDIAIPLYSLHGLIDITAGDFDGDGVEELAVYAPNNADSIETTTQPYQPNHLEIRIYDYKIDEQWGNMLVGTAREQVIPLADGTTEWTWSSDGGTKQYYSIPYVSLTADDVNGDGIDDLMAVTSFSHKFRGFNNGIGKGYTWEQVLNPDTCFASVLDVFEGSRTEDGKTSFVHTVTKKPLIGKDDDGAYVLRNATAVVADVTGVGSREIVFGGNYTKITYNNSTTTNTIVATTRDVTMSGECLNTILGYTTYENLTKDKTLASSLKYNWIQQKGNSNKVGQEANTRMNEPVSLIGFSAFGSALPNAVFLEGQVFSYGDEGKMELVYSVPKLPCPHTWHHHK